MLWRISVRSMPLTRTVGRCFNPGGVGIGLWFVVMDDNGIKLLALHLDLVFILLDQRSRLGWTALEFFDVGALGNEFGRHVGSCDGAGGEVLLVRIGDVLGLA